MFSIFARRHDVFEERKSRQEVWRTIRRLIDASTQLEIDANEIRQFKRYKRHIPIAFFPCAEEGLVAADAIYAVTKDFSDNGVCLIANTPHMHNSGVCGFWVDQPLLFSATVHYWKPFGGNMIEAGVELTSIIHCSQTLELLDEQLQNLLPADVAVDAH